MNCTAHRCTHGARPVATPVTPQGFLSKPRVSYPGLPRARPISTPTGLLISHPPARTIWRRPFQNPRRRSLSTLVRFFLAPFFHFWGAVARPPTTTVDRHRHR
jgi:hypothetical protein